MTDSRFVDDGDSDQVDYDDAVMNSVRIAAARERVRLGVPPTFCASPGCQNVIDAADPGSDGPNGKICTSHTREMNAELAKGDPWLRHE